MFKYVELPSSEGGTHKWIFRPEEIFQIYKVANSNKIEVELRDGTGFTVDFSTPEAADQSFLEIQKALLNS